MRNAQPLTPLDGGVLLLYECHEGNYAIRHRSALSARRTRRWPTIIVPERPPK